MALRMDETKQIHEELARLRELLLQSTLSQRSHHYQNLVADGNSQVHLGDVHNNSHQHNHYHYHHNLPQQQQPPAPHDGQGVAAGNRPYHYLGIAELDPDGSYIDRQIRETLNRLFGLMMENEESLSPSQARSSIRDISTILQHITSTGPSHTTICEPCRSKHLDRMMNVIQLTRTIQKGFTKTSIPVSHLSGVNTGPKAGFHPFPKPSVDSDPCIGNLDRRLSFREQQAGTCSLASGPMNDIVEHGPYDPRPINDTDVPSVSPTPDTQIRKRRARHARNFVTKESTRKMSNMTAESSGSIDRSMKLTQLASWETSDIRLDLILNEKRPNSLYDCAQQCHSQHEIYSVAIVMTPTHSSSFDQQLAFRFQQNSSCTSTLVLPSFLEIRNIRPSDAEIFRVAARGSVDEMNYLLATGKGSLKDCDTYGVSLLGYALNKMNTGMVEFLLRNKADVDAIEPWLVSPGSSEFIGPVLKQAWSNHGESSGQEQHDNMECIKHMLRFATDPTQTDSSGDPSVSHKIIYGNTVETARALLDHGYPFVSSRSIMGEEECPLIYLVRAHAFSDSATYQIPEKILLFLQRGADPNAHDRSGNTCLHIGMKYFFEDLPDVRVYQNLVSSKYDGELKDILMLLITAGADVCAKNNDGESPSSVADYYNHWQEWTDALVECGYDPEEVDVDEEEEESTCWTSGTDHVTRILRPKLLSFAEYLEIRKARLNRIVEVDDSEAETEKDDQISETESMEWSSDDNLGPTDTIEEEPGSESEHETSDDQETHEYSNENSHAGSKRKAD